MSSSGDGEEASDPGDGEGASDPADGDVADSGGADEADSAGNAGEADGAGDTGGAGETSDGPDWREDPDPDPPSLGPEVPSVDVPEVEVPGTDSATGDTAVNADVEVDVDTAKGFWRLVLIFDVALLGLALGPMFVYFQDDWRRGGMLIAFGVLAFLYGVARYRAFQAADSDDDPDADTEPVDEA